MTDSGTRVVVFDIDGTLCLGGTAVHGAVALVRRVADAGMAVAFCTNNSTGTRRSIAEKLSYLGFPAATEAVFSTPYAAAKLLQAQHPDASVASIGTDGLRQELVAAGISLSARPEHADALVVGLDPTLTAGTISGIRQLPHGAMIIACNADLAFPVEEGRLMPGCGFTLKVIEQALGRRADVVIGKPEPFMLALICDRYGVSPRDVVMIGDSPSSDGAMALAAGAPFIHVDPAAEGFSLRETLAEEIFAAAEGGRG